MILGLAPMDGITDLPCRIITKKIFEQYNNAPDTNLRLRSEFMTSDGFLACPENVVQHIIHTDYENPLILQIFGGNTEKLEKTVLLIQKTFGNKLFGLELNTGCPANNIMKSGGGASLLKDKDRTLEIIKKLSNICQTNFSIKTRTGVNNIDKSRQMDFLIKASEYCSFISVHSRTLKDLYHGEGDWDFIYTLKNNANKKCKIIGNGAIGDHLTIGNKIKNLDGIMIGQSAIGNPRIFTNHEPDKNEKIKTAIEHLLLLAKWEIYLKNIKNNRQEKTYPTLQEIENIEIKNDKEIFYTPLMFRKFFHQYIKGIPGGKEAKQLCNQTTNLKGMINILQNI